MESDKIDIDAAYERMVKLFQYRVVVIIYLENHKQAHATKRWIKTNKSQSNLRKLVYVAHLLAVKVMTWQTEQTSKFLLK